MAYCFFQHENGPVIGVDEAGRGPLAGPVVAAAVVLGADVPMGLDDSKKLSAKRREVLEAEIKANCDWAIGVVEADEIDRINIFAATMRAMTRAVSALCDQLGQAPAQILVDGPHTPAGREADWQWPSRGIIGGDALEPCISAASIIAKTHRDCLMRALAAQYPVYGWERNAGYGTAEHLAALRRHGPAPCHRRSFKPVGAIASQILVSGGSEIAAI